LKDDIKTWSTDIGRFKGDHQFEERTERLLTHNSAEIQKGSISSASPMDQSGHISPPIPSAADYHPQEKQSAQVPVFAEDPGPVMMEETVVPAPQPSGTKAPDDARSKRRAGADLRRTDPIPPADALRHKLVTPSGELSDEGNKPTHTLPYEDSEYRPEDTETSVWWILIGIMFVFGAMYYMAIGLSILLASCLIWEFMGIGKIIHQGIIERFYFLNRRGVFS
jgi:hypothetical protein